MKKTIFMLAQLLFIFSIFSQEKDDNNNNRNSTRQGFGTHSFFDMGPGFVNAKTETEGSAYYFDNWDTKGLIYTKDKKRYKVKKININLYDNTLEAIYDQNSVFTFNSDNLVKIIINGKVFRLFTIGKERKILELFFNDKHIVYKHNIVSFYKSSTNPMVSRKNNKYIKRSKYYLYEKGKLTKIKQSEKKFSKLFKTNNLNQNSIIKFIKENKLSLKKEMDLTKILSFISQQN